MSGVSSGSRLERLYALRDQIAHEIAHEERLVALDGGRIDQKGRRRFVVFKGSNQAVATRGADKRKAASLDELGVTAKQVKVWAVSVGLVDAVHRGRVAQTLVDAYAEAHVDADLGEVTA